MKLNALDIAITLRFLSVGLIASAALTSNAQETNSRSIDEIIVQGRAKELYRTPVTTSGKLETAQVDSSITITAITADLIIDQGARDAADIYRNISGVTAFSYSGITARGFRQGDIFFDGLRGDLFP